MGGWAIFLWFLAALAVSTGDMVVAAFFGCIAALLTYLRVTKESRRKKEAEKIRKMKEEKERLRKQQVRVDAKTRFGSIRFVAMLISDFKARNWKDLERTAGGIKVYNEKIETPYKTYYFDKYGLDRLKNDACEQLCEYIGMVYAGNYIVEKMTRCIGGGTGSYKGYMGSDGSISIYSDSDYSEITEGYRVYANILPPKPPLQKW